MHQDLDVAGLPRTPSSGKSRLKPSHDTSSFLSFSWGPFPPLSKFSRDPLLLLSTAAAASKTPGDAQGYQCPTGLRDSQKTECPSLLGVGDPKVLNQTNAAPLSVA